MPFRRPSPGIWYCPTIHTNDAPSTVIRLLDLGVPAFLIQATLVGILSQRLVRKICPFCKEPFEIDAAELLQMGLATRRSGPIRLSVCSEERAVIAAEEQAIMAESPFTRFWRIPRR